MLTEQSKWKQGQAIQNCKQSPKSMKSKIKSKTTRKHWGECQEAWRKGHKHLFKRWKQVWYYNYFNLSENWNNLLMNVVKCCPESLDITLGLRTLKLWKSQTNCDIWLGSSLCVCVCVCVHLSYICHISAYFIQIVSMLILGVLKHSCSIKNIDFFK